MEDEDEAQGGQQKDEKDKKGTNTCEHKRTKKEYIMGADTGDKICLDCGKTV